MLAESLEELRHEVVRDFESRCARRGGHSRRRADALGALAPELLPDVSATLRRGHVPAAPAGEEAVAPLRADAGREGQEPVEASTDEYGLLADCIHDLIERHGLEVPSQELRLLSRWLVARSSAPALARAAGLAEQNRRLAALVAVISRDIDDRKRAHEDLSHALAFREQVMGILGHDLRSPLGAVRALTSLVLRREGLPEGVRESLAEIDRAGKRMLDLIATLLDFSESRFTGVLPIAPAPADMHELCRGAIEELLAAHPGRSIDVDVEGDGCGTWDPIRLSQVVSNLVGNALQHGTRFGPVRVSIRGDEEAVVLEVANDGPAIAPDLLPVLFEPFRGGSTGPGSPPRGLGLGLYIVRQIVNAHGGEISVESTAERGTVFTVTLPRACETPLAANESPRPSWRGEAPAGGS